MTPASPSFSRIPGGQGLCSFIPHNSFKKLGIFHTFHSVGFSCTRLAISKYCTIEPFQYRINDGSKGLFIDLHLGFSIVHIVHILIQHFSTKIHKIPTYCRKRRQIQRLSPPFRKFGAVPQFHLDRGARGRRYNAYYNAVKTGQQ